MAQYSFYIYAAGAVTYDSGSNTFTLDPNYDFTQDRSLVEVTDDDTFFDGDLGADEVGEDTTQDGVIYDTQMNVIDSGRIYVEAFAVLSDGTGGSMTLDRIEINGVLVGYSPSQEMVPGQAYAFVSETIVDDGGDGSDTRMTYSQYLAQSVPCFVSGTLLETADGLLPIDWIGVGDRVRTADHGWQTVRWRGHREFRYAPNMPNPIEIAPNALGPGAPSEVLRLSPQHRIVLDGPQIQLLFGEEEVFVAAKHLLHLKGISAIRPDPDLAYHHLLFDQHEVLFSSAVRLESLFLGANAQTMDMLPSPEISPEMRLGHRQTARMCLTGREARLIAPEVKADIQVRPTTLHSRFRPAA